MKTTCVLKAVLVMTWLSGTLARTQNSDLLIADFESDSYGAWRATGTAFGAGPARGTLASQMQVTGYRGERLVNSFHGGDGAVGTLTSPPLRVERDFLAFRVGGGGFPEKTCINLLLDGEVVRTATGPNTDPGGSEELEPHAWDVRDLKGRQVVLQIVDQATGGWGHINIDHLVQTDTRPPLPVHRALEREFTIDRHYLLIPIKNGARRTEVSLAVEGVLVRRYTTELATDPEDVDWYAFFNLSDSLGKRARASAARTTEEAFALVRQADTVPGADNWYSEPLRPQFHFSQAVGWNNDPNGMVWLDGEWHLFFQHNPVGWNWGNMTWGHAVSPDLVHWRQLPEALFPKTMATGDCFSGGGLVDRRNTAGWKTGTNDVLVVFLTDTGAGESVAYSNDRGRSFTWHEGNPVVQHRGRDPKVIWYAYGDGDEPLDATARDLGGHWVMAVYDEHDQHGRNIAFHTSTDLKHWTGQSHLSGYYECPEIFPLAVDGTVARTRWVVFAADAQYAVGRFDGRTFTPEHAGKHRVHWGKYYASQTFSDAPDGRRIQIGWAQIAMPGMPFNQTFSFPHELTLRTTADGIRLFAKPVAEIERLHRNRRSAAPQALSGDRVVALEESGDRIEVRARFRIGEAKEIGLDIGGNRIVYDAVNQRLGEATLQPVDGQLTLQVLVDRPMIEICANDGRVFMTLERAHRGAIGTIKAFAAGGAARLEEFEAFALASIWRD
ncbi:MAG: glycoside hydrolase family 32 protein [Verrucomicrobiales bacterium]|nr:glycoside hydrolase family 32 protein [Verrucomicrobiales bacterium]MCP5528314.1 glycoside hydrolase family 32 protein [Verrucomicrobiales bacterium]